MNWNQLGMELLDNTIAVVATDMLNVSSMVLKNGDSDMVRYVKMGAIASAISELLLLVKVGKTHTQNGDVYFLVDDIFFNSVVWAVLDKPNLGIRVSDKLDFLPFGSSVNGAVATSVLKISAKMLREVLDANWDNSPVSYVSHISKLWA